MLRQFCLSSVILCTLCTFLNKSLFPHGSMEQNANKDCYPILFIQPLQRYDFEKPFVILDMPDIPEDESTNLAFDEHPVKLHNMRTQKDKLSLEHDYFCISEHKTNVRNFRNLAAIKDYGSEVAEILSGLTSAHRIICSDYGVSIQEQISRRRQLICVATPQRCNNRRTAFYEQSCTRSTYYGCTYRCVRERCCDSHV